MDKDIMIKVGKSYIKLSVILAGSDFESDEVTRLTLQGLIEKIEEQAEEIKKLKDQLKAWGVVF